MFDKEEELIVAKVIEARGRGMREGGFFHLTQLAENLGGQIGCTRPCVDLGLAKPELLLNQICIWLVEFPGQYRMYPE